jgi:hypothetical protein
MAFGSIGKFFEGLGGPKMGNAARYHDPAELKKWKDRSEKTYGKFGKRREKYGGRADKEYDRYSRSRGEAQRLYGRMESATGQAQGAISQAAMRERRAGELADDRQHYAGLRERAESRRKQREGYRLELESQQSDPGSFDSVQAMVMDAAKLGNDAYMAQTEAVVSGLAKTNPVAAAKLMLDAKSNAATNLGKAKQQGWFAGQENKFKEFTMAAEKIGMQTALLGNDEQADRYLSEARNQQINEQLSLSTAALNRSGASLNVAGMYGQQGAQLDAMAQHAAGMSQNYDQMGNQMLTEEASIEQQEKGREQELMMSDRMAQQQVDEYNAGRMNRGIQTSLQALGTVTDMYTGISAGRASNAEADMYGRIGQKTERPLGNNVSTKRNADMNTRFVSTTGSSPNKFSNFNVSGFQQDPYKTNYTNTLSNVQGYQQDPYKKNYSHPNDWKQNWGNNPGNRNVQGGATNRGTRRW